MEGGNCSPSCPKAPLQGPPATSSPPGSLHSARPSAAGLKRIHVLTVQGSYELRIDLEDFDNGTAFAHYGSFGVGLFSVDPEEDGYPVSIADYSGTAGRAAGRGTCMVPRDRGSPWPPNPLTGVLVVSSSAGSGAGCTPAATGSWRQERGCCWAFAEWVTPSALYLTEGPHWGAQRSPTG